MKQKTALICTTYNCKDELDASLKTFTSPDNLALVQEIVVVDGGSRDGTWELLKAWAEKIDKLKVYQVPGANISRGRNEAVRRTDAQIIVTFDSGTQYVDNWLRLMLKPFEDSQVSVVGGLTVCFGQTFFEKSFAGFDERQRIDAQLGASHRGIAYRRQVWDRIGGYPEHVEAGEDTWFNTMWRKLGFKYVHIPEARNYWRVRSNWTGVFKMARRNTRGHVALGETSGTPQVFAITAVYILVPVFVILGFYQPVILYIAPGLFILYIATRMLGKGRWKTFMNPLKFMGGLYALTASDLGTLAGAIEGSVLYVKHKIADKRGCGHV